MGLFNTSYAKWGPEGPNPGEPVRQSAQSFQGRLDDQDAWITLAYDGSLLVGYCVGIRTKMPGDWPVVWVSQLVVLPAYRKARVATTLLYSTWQYSDCFAWGLATANPFAVRALETATRRPCSVRRIRADGPAVLASVRSHVSYLPETLVKDDAGVMQPRVDTRFPVDHKEIPAMQARAARGNRRWSLGSLQPGEEWFACTFASQTPAAMDDERLAALLQAADRVWIQAYEGMTLDASHRWHAHAGDEVDFILAAVAPNRAARVLDVGCGDGRHVDEFAQRGFDVTGIDVSRSLVDIAQKRCTHPSASFAVMDAREQIPGSGYDLITCLYDVVGSSARRDDDIAIVTRMKEALAPGGVLVVSVMNTTPTLAALPEENRPATTQALLQALEALPASTTMQSSGAVFDPELLVYFDGIYHRKEQFAARDGTAPRTVLVRDRRFSSEDIEQLLGAAGLTVDGVHPVQAGSWDRRPMLDESDPKAKELIVIARRPE